MKKIVISILLTFSLNAMQENKHDLSAYDPMTRERILQCLLYQEQKEYEADDEAEYQKKNINILTAIDFKN